MLFLENTVLHQGWTVPNTVNVTDPVNKYALTVQARQFLAIKEAQAQLCHENMDVKDLAYMGTASVVRDIDFMTRVLDGEEAKMFVLSCMYARRGLTSVPVITLASHTAPSSEPCL
jgi:hypothetical protein